MKRSENLIIVEGDDDIHVLIRCIEHFQYELNPERHPEERFASRSKLERCSKRTLVEYATGNQKSSSAQSMGKEAALKRLRNEVKAQSRRGVAIIVDADQNLDGTWSSIRDAAGLAASVPLPNEGYVGIASDAGMVLGCWVMPDNFAEGNIEDFLLQIVEPDQTNGLSHAKNVVANLPAGVGRFKPEAKVKSELHTWLAWQEEPGPRPSVAITRELLSLRAPSASRFLGWLDRWLREIEKGVQE